MTELAEVRRSARSFASAEELRAWFVVHHAQESELWIAYPKRGSGLLGISYEEAVTEALCFGWIDGQVRSLGPSTYANRYSPRRPGSSWSRVNVERARTLLRAGRMHRAGRRAFEERGAAPPRRYSYERPPRTLAPGLVGEFRRAHAAYAFFAAQAPSYRRAATFWVMSGKRPATRARRLALLRAASARHRRVDLLSPGRSSRSRRRQPARRPVRRG